MSFTIDKDVLLVDDQKKLSSIKTAKFVKGEELTMSSTFDKHLPSIDDRKKLSSAKTATKKKVMKKSKKVVRKKSRAKTASHKAPAKGFFAKLKKLAGF